MPPALQSPRVDPVFLMAQCRMDPRFGRSKGLISVAHTKERRPSAAFGAQRQLFEAEAEKDEFRIQFQSMMPQFRAREVWWRAKARSAMVYFETTKSNSKPDSNGNNAFEVLSRWWMKLAHTAVIK